MKLFIFSCLALFCAFNLQAANDVTDKATGESFPASVSFEDQGKKFDLDITGVSTRKKLMFKIYSVAHYLQKGVITSSDPLQAILSDDNAKQLTIKWVRDVPGDRVREGYEESFKTAISSPDYTQLQSAIDTYIGFFDHDVKKGDVHTIRWIPSGIIEVQINGKPVGKVSSPEFAKGLWNIWFGTKSVVNRENLLSSIK
jgi:hypothetical protein